LRSRALNLGLSIPPFFPFFSFFFSFLLLL
jgi:hypothetical protein